METLRLLFGLTRSVDQKTYVIAGVALAVLKYVLDFAVVNLATGSIWPVTAYLSPLLTLRNEVLGPAPELLLWGMAAYALPFAWVGLSMSVRRAANAGLPPWIGVLFLLPFVNWLVILFLCSRPTRGTWEVGEAGDVVPLNLKTALLSVGIGVALVMSMVATSVFILKDYGWSMFIATPFVIGVVAGYLTNRSGRSSAAAAAGTAAVTVVLSGLAMLLFAVEGLICILMASVPALVMAVGGALIGRAIASATKANARGLTMMVLMLPFLAATESLTDQQELFEVATAVEIDAPPMEVWDNVIQFSEIPPPAQWVQDLGIAIPLRARIFGEGVGAVRHCEFTTGPFVEPVTVWEPGVRLAFSVTEQPPPLKEWSPYAGLHPPHLDGYLRSKRGEFRLVELPGGRTRLEGSTWYELDIAPRAYWSLWGDTIIHRIHLHVLEHIKRETER